MFGNVDLQKELLKMRRTVQKEDGLVSDAKRILKRDLFTENKVLENLEQYNQSHKTLDEEDLDPDFVFTPDEIRRLAVKYRLKFLEDRFFKPEIPYDATLKINAINDKFYKDIKLFNVLSVPNSFESSLSTSSSFLFFRTNYENYYLVYNWGRPLKKIRSVLFLPLRKFENLIIFVLLFTLILTLSLPTRLITLDHSATYWSGYRAAAFFHLLIFNAGVTVYFTFTFAKNFSESIWKRYEDF